MLPCYAGAVRGIVDAGDPIGNVWYPLACFVVAALAVGAAWSVRPVLPDRQRRSTGPGSEPTGAAATRPVIG